MILKNQTKKTNTKNDRTDCQLVFLRKKIIIERKLAKKEELIQKPTSNCFDRNVFAFQETKTKTTKKNFKKLRIRKKNFELGFSLQCGFFLADIDL